MLVGWQTKRKDKSYTWPEMLGTSQPPVALPASQGFTLNSADNFGGLGAGMSVAFSCTVGSSSAVSTSILWSEIWVQVSHQMVSCTTISMHAGVCLPQSRTYIHPQPNLCLWQLTGALISSLASSRKDPLPILQLQSVQGYLRSLRIVGIS